MKKFYLIFIPIFLTILNIANAQWVQQTSGTTNDLYSVYCVNADTVYTVGANGTILKTTDGGTNWNTQTSGITDTLNSVYCINADTVFTVGNNGTILKTINGGLNWDTLTSGTTNNLNSVFFVNADTGYTVGDLGTILKTINKGINWDTLNSGIIDNLNSVFFVNADTGYTVGDLGTILKTINGGIDWIFLPSPIDDLYSIYFKNDSNGFIVGFLGTFLKTTDGGNSWSETEIIGSGTLYSVHFPTLDTGYVAGYCIMPAGGYIVKTVDGGINWDIELSGILGCEFYSVFFLTADTGYVVGGDGKIYKNGGDTTGVGIYNKIKYNKEIIKIIPNPTEESFTIEIQEIYKGNKVIKVYGISGVLVKEYLLEKGSNRTTVHTAGWAKGVYICKLVIDGKVMKSEKMVVE